MIVQKESFEKIVARCNRLGVPVAAGGPFPTSCREEITGVDYFILGEGEVTFPLFLEAWERESPGGVFETGEKTRPFGGSGSPTSTSSTRTNTTSFPSSFRGAVPSAASSATS